MKSILIAAAAVMALSGVATAQEAGTQEAGDAQEEPKPEKKICRTDRSTGSLTRRTRICMTESQWRELNSRTRRGVDEMQGSASGGQAVSNNPGAGGPG